MTAGGLLEVSEHPERNVISRESFDSAQDRLRDREILDSSPPLRSISE